MYFEFKKTKIYYEILDCESLLPPIVFLHGWGGSTKSFEYFAKKFWKMGRKCVLIDFPPFGNSGKIVNPWNVKTYSQAVIKLLKINRIKQIDIIAHSFGGRVALELDANCKNKINVRKMLLTGCAGLKKKSLKLKIKIFWFKFVKFLCKIKLLRKSILDKFGSKDYKDLDKNMKKTFLNIVNYDQKYLLKSVSSEVLFFWGKKDKETPFYFTKIFKKHIKNSEVVGVFEAGHFAYLQRPNMFFDIAKVFLT